MKRQDKITRLAAVGFNAIELSRMSNELLDSTYSASGPLLASKQKELQQALRRESKHSREKRAEIAKQQEAARVELEWLNRWKPVKPIDGLKNRITEDVKLENSIIERAERAVKKNTELFRTTADKKYADAANAARTTLREVQAHLKEVAQ